MSMECYLCYSYGPELTGQQSLKSTLSEKTEIALLSAAGRAAQGLTSLQKASLLLLSATLFSKVLGDSH